MRRGTSVRGAVGTGYLLRFACSSSSAEEMAAFAENLVFENGQLYRLSSAYVHIDNNGYENVSVSELTAKQLCNFSARRVLKSASNVTLENVVVVKIRECVGWFVRICDDRVLNEADGKPMGYSYLWRLPSAWCERLLDKAAQTQATSTSLYLVSIFRNRGSVEVASVGNVVHELATPSDRLYFCCMRPHCESARPAPPPALAAGRCLDLQSLPYDVVEMIIKRVVTDCAANGAFSQIAALRSTSKAFKQTTDRAQTRIFKRMKRAVTEALCSKDVGHMRMARNRILLAGLTPLTLPLVCV